MPRCSNGYFEGHRSTVGKGNGIGINKPCAGCECNTDDTVAGVTYGGKTGVFAVYIPVAVFNRDNGTVGNANCRRRIIRICHSIDVNESARISRGLFDRNNSSSLLTLCAEIGADTVNTPITVLINGDYGGIATSGRGIGGYYEIVGCVCYGKGGCCVVRISDCVDVYVAESFGFFD